MFEKFGLRIDPKASVVETTEIYNEYITSVSSDRNIRLDSATKVDYPVYPSKVLYDVENSVLQKFGSFDMSAGGSFISDASLIKDSDLPGTLQLVTTFLNFDQKNLQHEATDQENGRYDHLPTLLRNFA